MTVVYTLLAGIAGMIVGYWVVAFAGFLVAGLFGMSDFEGGRAMFAAFVMGPIGAVAGLIGGMVLVGRLRRRAQSAARRQ